MYKSDVLIKKALSYIGYLEKASDKDLDDFTANAGRGNYTRFCRDYEQYTNTKGFQPSYWCAEFVSCVVVEAFGLTAAKELLCGSLFASCTAGKDAFVKRGQFHTASPLPGDIIMFKKNGSSTTMAHCGIVVKVDSSYVYTVEGNTSSGNNTVIDNGGCVAEKKYHLSNAKIGGYCRMALDDCSPQGPSKGATIKIKNVRIGNFQKWLNKKFGSHLTIDGVFGKCTKRDALKAFQKVLNASGNVSLVIDGLWGPRTESASEVVKNGSKGDLVYILQGMLYCRGYDPKGFDGICGSKTVAAIKNFQRRYFTGHDVDGECGPKTWSKLFA